MFENIKESAIGRSLIRFSKERHLRIMSAEDIFDVPTLLFPEPNITELSSEDEIASLKLAQLALLREHAYSTWLDLVAIFKLCDSPIEKHFLSALIVVVKDMQMDVTVEADMIHLDPPPGFLIYPQKQIGDYRVDFLIVFHSDSVLDDAQSKASQRVRESAKLVVECDGHEFHEKTKEQASRDKERDRTLQACGFPVFRYSGSDIYCHPIDCAHECLSFLFEQQTGLSLR